jgi:hypothetical protein
MQYTAYCDTVGQQITKICIWIQTASTKKPGSRESPLRAHVIVSAEKQKVQLSIEGTW